MLIQSLLVVIGLSALASAQNTAEQYKDWKWTESDDQCKDQPCGATCQASNCAEPRDGCGYTVTNEGRCMKKDGFKRCVCFAPNSRETVGCGLASSIDPEKVNCKAGGVCSKRCLSDQGGITVNEEGCKRMFFTACDQPGKPPAFFYF